MYRVGGAYAYTWHSLLAERHLDSAESAGHTASTAPGFPSEAGALSRQACSGTSPSLLALSLPLFSDSDGDLRHHSTASKVIYMYC